MKSPREANWIDGLAALAAIVVVFAILAALGSGCCNVMVRGEKPYFVAPEPYHCTASVAEDAVAAPFKDRSGEDAIMDAVFTLTWPVWLVDLPCEAVLDTVFLPVDAAFGKK